MNGFFDGYTAEAIVGLVITGLFGLFPGLNVFNWFKHQFGVVDSQAHTMVMVLSVALTAASMFIAGSLGLEGFEFTLGNVLSFSGTLYAASQVAYNRFKSA